MVQELGWTVRPRRDDYDAIHRALLSGFLSGIALRQERNQYQGAGGLRWQLWPGSSLTGSPPAWVMAAELVEIERRFGRTVAKIQPQWLESAAEHLIVFHYDKPHWSDSRQCCLAHERGTLFGLPAIASRIAPYAPIDPEAARRILIEAGLVGGKLRRPFAFHHANQQLRERVATWAAKTRDRRFVVDDWSVARFYEERLPRDAVDAAALERSLRKEPALEPRLRMTEGDLLPDVPVPRAADFPDQIEVGTMRLKLRYRFEPGADDDGVNVDVPLAGLPQLAQESMDWLVPGRLIELVAELIRSLPKPLRRTLVPIPEAAAKASALIEFGRGEVLDAIARQLTAISESPIRPTDFQLAQLPKHLKVNVRVLDDQGKILVQGRDLGELRRAVGSAAGLPAQVAPDVAAWNKSNLTAWDFGDLPESVSVRRGGVDLQLFPTLSDEGASVALRLVETSDSARWHLERGAARLFQLSQRKGIQSQLQWLPDLPTLAASLAKWLPADSLRERLGDLLARMALSAVEPRTQTAFEKAVEQGGGLLAAAAQQVGTWVAELSREAHVMRLALERASSLTRDRIGGDIDAQLAELFGVDFAGSIPWIWLPQFPRYLAAIRVRIERAASNIERDRAAAEEIRLHESRFAAERNRASPPYPIHAGLSEYRWLIEELRVSLFAQQLGTRLPVSSKRLDKLWRDIAKT
jgi:ATP-dependent helicase HrpA